MTATTTTTHPRRLSDQTSTEELFGLVREGDRAAREQLALRFMPLARKVSRRYSNSSLSSEDLTQVANLALVKAIDRFDPDVGRSFEAFAIPTILGELRRYFRDSAWSVHVARGAKERSKAVQDASEMLAREHGRAPSVSQLAVYLELSEEDVLDALQVAQAYAADSLDAPVRSGEEDVTLVSTLGERELGYERAETNMLIEDALTELSERERRALKLRFVDELTQLQIGHELGVSQMQVSRILRATLAKLRDRLGDAAALA